MSYELLQELRDISSMAVEHFKEHIDPTMKRIQMINNAIRNNSSRFIRCVADADDSLLINSQKRQIVDLKTKVIIVVWSFKNIMKFGAHFIVPSR
jgi:hypothetical protein